MPKGRWMVAALATIAVGACDDAGDSAGGIELRFEALANGATVACGQTFGGIGTSASEISLQDFRFYVHDVRLVDAGGAETAVALVADGKWQTEDIALIDFEDASGGCSNGTMETRQIVVGDAPAGDYTGLRFRLGVPEADNHGDAATAPSPLNLSKMFWSWTNGYKFLRLDVSTTGQPGGYNVHIGSVGCDGGPGLTTTCTHTNRPEIALDAFDVDDDVVVFDVAALFAGTNVDTNVAPAAGCQSGFDDADCAPIFDQLGLDFNGTVASGAQKVFVRKAL